jgi:hypothetical protein
MERRKLVKVKVIELNTELKQVKSIIKKNIEGKDNGKNCNMDVER